VIKDLVTKKQITIHITPDAQMRKLPERMASLLAARLKGGSSGGSGGTGSTQHAAGGQGGGGKWSGQAGGQTGGQGAAGADPQQLLNRAPTIQIADLKKGDAVMLVSTDGTTDVTAITLVAGVEPLLEAPEASQSLLNNWSMSSGSGAADAAAQ
jgi:hypothetical protein